MTVYGGLQWFDMVLLAPLECFKMANGKINREKDLLRKYLGQLAINWL